MLQRNPTRSQSSLFFTFEDTLNPKHPLYILSKEIDWVEFEQAFSPLYCQDNGRPGKPIRLMVGLLILKHLRNLSDENVVEQWSENIYYQYFCGGQEFVPGVPCDASELVHFRHRIGEEGCELIFRESIRINGDDSKEGDVIADTTVQEKNITYPTDAKLHRKIINKCKKMAGREGIVLRQSYTRTLKKLGIDQRFRNHPRNKKKALKADRKIKTIAWRLVREMERKLPADSFYRIELSLFRKVLEQQKKDKHKIYSLHEPEVECISKGKEHKKYEFGNKVSILYTQTTGVIVGACSFRNPYDGHTLPQALDQRERLVGKKAKTSTCDRGYRGKSEVDGTKIQIPKPFNDKTQSKYMQRKLRNAFRRRAAVEPVIGHLKQDHRLCRNYYAGVDGDNINVLLAAAAFNFKRMMNKWKLFCLFFMDKIFAFIKKCLTPVNLLKPGLPQKEAF